MLIEWLRRVDTSFDRHLRTYLFTTGPITELEAAATAGSDSETGPRSTPNG